MQKDHGVHPCAGLPDKPCVLLIPLRRKRCVCCGVEYERLRGNAIRRQQKAQLRQLRETGRIG